MAHLQLKEAAADIVCESGGKSASKHNLSHIQSSKCLQQPGKHERQRSDTPYKSSLDVLLGIPVDSAEPSPKADMIAVMCTLQSLNTKIESVLNRVSNIEQILDQAKARALKSSSLLETPCSGASSSSPSPSASLAMKDMNSETDPSTVFVGDPGFDVKADKLAVTRAIAKAGKRSQLALALIDVFFPYEVLAESTAHGSRDGAKKPLDPKIIEEIRSQCLLKFPLLPHETFKDMSWESYQKPSQTSAWASAEAERKRRLDLS